MATTTTTKKISPQSDLDRALEVRNSSKSMAEAVRTLHKEWGNDRGRISRALNIRYQWVRNVLITPVRKGS